MRFRLRLAVLGCFNATTLIGTCTEPEAMNPHCDNTQGCCSAFYCASMGG
jgi:hypothetical protein